jgi:DNA primase
MPPPAEGAAFAACGTMAHASRMEHSHLLSAAAEYHAALPPRIRTYLNDRGIPDPLIDVHQLGWNGSRITIPIFDRNGELTFFKLAKDPGDGSSGPKILATPGARLELYGWDEVLKAPDEIIVCEGEFDRLVLKAQGFRAVTSTAGARAFRAEWATDFDAIPKVFICFDRDEAGQAGARRVARLIPRARIVDLPEEVGEGGDVTDFFVRLGRTDDEFRALLERAPAIASNAEPSEKVEQFARVGSPLRRRIEHLKQAVPIAEVVGKYVELVGTGDNLMGLCPFHADNARSLAVYPRTGTFYCFGCGEHGDVITFLKAVESLTFMQTLDCLEKLASHDSRDAT